LSVLAAVFGPQLRGTRLAFGTGSLHHLTSSRARQQLLGAAWEQGIRHFDTAPLYGHGLAERELGLFARGRREHVLLASKFGIPPVAALERWPALLYPRMAGGALLRKWGLRERGRAAHDYDPAHVRHGVEESLRRLRTDYVDVLFVHEPPLELEAGIHGLARVLEGLKAEGKVRAIGLSGTGEACAALARACPAVSGVLQVDAHADCGGLAAVRAAGLPVHVSFGHFRGVLHGPDAAGGFGAALAEAVRQNPAGVILFSTRRAGRIAQAARQLEAIERGLVPC
jgi:aryl-alcohol dehydrogenase-like predicted oxidoreductase